MIFNYLKIALRVLSKNKVFSFINIGGMAIGLACVLTLLAYVRLELSYDKFHPDHDNIYRITTISRTGEHSAYSYMPLSPLLTEHLSGLKRVVRIFPMSGLVSNDKRNKIRESNFCLADSTFFNVFAFQCIEGSLNKVLAKPMSVVLTRSAAIKYFSSTRVVGRELFFEDDAGTNSFTVAAVINDMPANSHFHFNFITAFESFKTIFPKGIDDQKAWYWPPMYTYIQMGQGTPAGINGQLEKIASSHLPDYVNHKAFAAQKLTDIHLTSALQNEWESNSNYTYIRVFVAIALFVLVIACINYVNLATAKAASRAGEVGIRKAMGSLRSQLIRMFIGESALTTALAILIGLALAQVGMSTLFHAFFTIELSINFIFQWPGIFYLVIGWGIVSIAAGIYPALYISSFNTVQALKGKSQRFGSVLSLRKALLVFQFFISAVLLIGTFLVIRQTNYLKNKSLGFSQDHVVTIVMNDAKDRQNYLTLKNKLLNNSAVQNVTVSAALPAGRGFYDWEVVPEGFKDRKDMVFQTLSTDEDFIKTFGLKLLHGRDFSIDVPSDKEQAFIINETMAKHLGWTDPVGKDFQLTFYTDGPIVRKGKVIGLVQDFHFKTLYNRIEPLVIFINTHFYYNDFMSVKLSKGNIASQVESLRKDWSTFSPEKPFEFTFLDDQLNQLYTSETTAARLLSFFSTLSIIISCLGLFGLSAYLMQQRTKEIGIRKVLGANELGIVGLLSSEFVILVIVANVLAWPLAWYGAGQWLSKFAYRVDVNMAIFIETIIVILLVTVITVGTQALRAALANPVNSLRNE